MNARSHSDLVNVICDIDNLLRGRYKRNEHRGVIVPLAVLLRLNCVLDAADGDPQAAWTCGASPDDAGADGAPTGPSGDAAARPAHHARAGR